MGREDTRSTSEDWPQMIKDCEAREKKLDDWERGFIKDIGKKVERKHHLTYGQIDALDKIWERVTS